MRRSLDVSVQRSRPAASKPLFPLARPSPRGTRDSHLFLRPRSPRCARDAVDARDPERGARATMGSQAREQDRGQHGRGRRGGSDDGATARHGRHGQRCGAPRAGRARPRGPDRRADLSLDARRGGGRRDRASGAQGQVGAGSRVPPAIGQGRTRGAFATEPGAPGRARRRAAASRGSVRLRSCRTTLRDDDPARRCRSWKVAAHRGVSNARRRLRPHTPRALSSLRKRDHFLAGRRGRSPGCRHLRPRRR